MSARKDSPPTPAAPSNPKSQKSNRASGEEEEEQRQQQRRRQARFPPEEEATLVAESNAHKSEANALFASSKYNAALGKYDEAVAACPTYLDYELAVLRSNIAACHLKLEEWKEAVGNATVALDDLDRLEREEAEREAAEKEEAGSNGALQDNDDEDDEVEEEVVSAGASKAAAVSAPTREKDAAAQARQKRRGDIARIRAKALMRRGRARSELGGWSNLEGALADYKALAAATATTALGAADRRIVQAQLVSLPARAKAAQEAETAEMWGKLKELGNGILKPFGLSTDSFQMVKDEKTGGYSMSFGSGPGGQ